ncbi:hypothetical protein C6Y14_19010 [Streptomyces dioscori]|uniref:DUF3152 domain-containing protein n=1 Tax=Streptomyces dioscori TaxID=2109333 RepID=A0A2P8Q6N3_9ACTN|nr:DUF3152 domain-containing protein [Streptomyces dioscori]PSM41907.1 hypothetical protein C6Y14_19010 [Streptomyces dioscori]
MINRRTTKPSPTARSRRRRRGSAGGSGSGSGREKGPLLWGVAALAVLSAAALAVSGGTPAASSSSGDPDSETEAAGGESNRSSQPSPESKPSAIPGNDESPDSAPSLSPSASSSPSIPSTGPGTFTTAGGGSGTVGKGARTLRYKVVVENGLAQSAADVARQVEEVLADRRGWTADGRSGFKRVSTGSTDFVVRLATPGTVDEICGRYGLNTRGEVNCSVGKDVVVNLKRWLLATPVYADDVAAYRALIINHEVGHFLGHGHVTCPGAGKPAPAMMQQIKGMRGCTPNVWPYDEKGRLVTGPRVP